MTAPSVRGGADAAFHLAERDDAIAGDVSSDKASGETTWNKIQIAQ